MHKPIFRIKYYWGFFAASLLVAAITISSDLSTRNLLENYQKVVQSYRIQKEIEQIALNVSNAQTHVRGYYISNQTAFHEEYLQEKKKIPITLRKIHELVRGNLTQQKQLQDLEALIAVRLGQLDSVIAQMKEGNLSSIYTPENIATFKRQENLIAEAVGAMIETEDSFLSGHLQNSEKLSTQAFSVVTAGGTLVLVLMNVAAYMVYRDSARRHRAEQELDKFFSVSLDFHVVAGIDGYFKKVNPAFEKLLGYTAEELYSNPFTQFIHPDDLESTRHEVEKLSKGESVIAFENRYIIKDGSIRWLLWRATPVGNTIYASARDVSDLHQTPTKKERPLDLGHS